MKILITGDLCPQDRVAEAIEKEDYSSIFGEVIEFTDKADYSIVNLETPIVESTTAIPIEKCGPSLKCSPKTINAIKYAGFDMVTLANNHFYDYGDEGVKQTIRECEKQDLDFVGGGMNIDKASKIFYKEIKGIKVAIINCCEHEFSIATNKSAGSNPLNPIRQYYSIQEAKKNADYVLVIVHGGHEGYQLPSPRMKETYRFFIDAGADAVVNHHQHCFSGYEIYRERPIIYGLGNFCFDRENKRNSIWNRGYMVCLDFNDRKVSINTIPYIQGNEMPGVFIIKDKENLQSFDNDVLSLNNIINDDEALSKSHKEWMNKTSKGYEFALEPYQGRILSVLYVRNLLPSFLTQNKMSRILNYIECESHLDRLRYVLKNKMSRK